MRLASTTLDAPSEKLLKDGSVGGVVFFKENATSAMQVIELTQSTTDSGFHPPLLSVDQEGGAVQRFEHIISGLPSAMALAANGQESNAKSVMQVCAQELKFLGFNCCLAPVLDILINPLNSVISTRSYGSDPETVSKFAKVAIDAFQKEGMIAVGKHFPGHGSASEDSHFALAVNNNSADNLWATELKPYRNCLAVLPAIMVGHIWAKQLDKEPLPASLSNTVITGILRTYLKYEGLIVTDDMVMQAITETYSLEEASLRALKAGADHILLGADSEQTKSVHAYLLGAVAKGDLSEDLIQKSYARLDKLLPSSHSKSRADQSNQRLDAIAKSVETNAPLLIESSASGIALLRGQVPKISSGEWVVVAPQHSRYPLKLVDHLNQQTAAIKDKLRFIDLRYSVDPSVEESEEIGKDCAERNCILLTFRAVLNQSQYQLARIIHANAREMVHVASDAPFDLVGLTDWQNCLATFDPSELAMKALARVLLGQIPALGTCPVDLSVPFNVIDQTSRI